MPKAMQSIRSVPVIDSGAANQKQAKEQIQADSAMAGSIGTSRWRRMMVVRPAMDNVINTARNWPNRLPPISEPHNITPTPSNAKVLPMRVERDGLSPIMK